MVSKLKRSNDRKVANSVTAKGTPNIANTFGLPAGKDYSCPNQTPTCASVCYAGKLEKLYKGVKENLLHNWNLLQNADFDTMVSLLNEMINDFNSECDKKNAPKLFRIHWDGDFFSDQYAYAWKSVISAHNDIQFWVYTRVPTAAVILKDIDNLSLYFSTDDDNLKHAENMKASGIRLAYLGKTFAVTESKMKELTGKIGARCPENAKQIPLVSPKGSACATCKLCVYGKADIRFSASKK
jgi:hypothetical protein